MDCASSSGRAQIRDALERGAFPLYEIEDGVRYTLNHTQRTRPVADYLALQRRCRHLPAAQTLTLQAEVDEGWARMLRRVAMNRPGANSV